MDGPDIRKISDIRLIFQYPKYRRIYRAKALDIRLSCLQKFSKVCVFISMLGKLPRIA